MPGPGAEAEALLAVAEEHEARFAPLLRFLLSTGARRAQKLGVRPLKLHAARHTFATLALQAGRSLRFVAEPLGHANPALTLRVHAHAVPVEGGDLAFADFGSTQDPSARSTEPTGDVSGSGSGFRTRQRPRRNCAGALQECWSTRRDLNPRPSRWQRDALPLSYARIRKGGITPREAARPVLLLNRRGFASAFAEPRSWALKSSPCQKVGRSLPLRGRGK